MADEGPPSDGIGYNLAYIGKDFTEVLASPFDQFGSLGPSSYVLVSL
jgi:hypothetical protein